MSKSLVISNSRVIVLTIVVLCMAYRLQISINDSNKTCIPTRDINDPDYRMNGAAYISRSANRSSFALSEDTRPIPTNAFELQAGVGRAITVYGKILDAQSCKPLPNTRIEIFQSCLNRSLVGIDADVNSDFIKTKKLVYTSANDCQGSVYSDNEGNYQFDTLIPITYMGHYPHIHYEVWANESRKQTVNDRRLMGTIYLRHLFPSQSAWIRLCNLIFGNECRILALHEWRNVPGIGYGPDFVLFNTATDYIHGDSWYNKETQKWMVPFNIVGSYVNGGTSFYALLFSWEWPFIRLINDIDFTFNEPPRE